MTIEELQKQHEAELTAAVTGLAGKGRDSDFALARALVHKAIHLVADRKAGEFSDSPYVSFSPMYLNDAKRSWVAQEYLIRLAPGTPLRRRPG